MEKNMENDMETMIIQLIIGMRRFQKRGFAVQRVLTPLPGIRQRSTPGYQGTRECVLLLSEQRSGRTSQTGLLRFVWVTGASMYSSRIISWTPTVMQNADQKALHSATGHMSTYFVYPGSGVQTLNPKP